MTRAAKRRRSELAKFHVGAKQLFGDDREADEDILEAGTTVRSSAGLDQAGWDAVVEHLKSCEAEFRPASKSGLRRNPPEPSPETVWQLSTIRAMLANGSLPDSYAEAILQRVRRRNFGDGSWGARRDVTGALMDSACVFPSGGGSVVLCSIARCASTNHPNRP